MGHPHSEALRLRERYRRRDFGHMDVETTIDDPQMYTKPWNPLNKFRMRLQPEWFDIREMICSASEAQEYNKTVAEQAVADKKANKK